MRFFVNFAAEDALLVHDNIVVNLYADAGEPLFRLDLRPPFEKALDDALASCDVFVFALSPASLADPWCARLYRRAAELGVPVKPVEVLPCEVPKELYHGDFLSITSITRSPFPFGTMPGFVTSGRKIEPAQVSVAATTPSGPPPHARIAGLDLNSGSAGLMMMLNGIDLNRPDAGRRVSDFFGGAGNSP
jgi:hypothetical protein